MQIVAGPNTLNVQMTAIVQTGTLSGQVTDSSTSGPISGVTVTLSGTTATTDSDGNFAFGNITPGTYTISFTKSGYQTVTK